MNAEHPPSLTSNLWFYAVDGNAVGPIPLDAIHALARQGVISADTYILKQDDTTWTTYGEVAARTVPQPPPLLAQPPSDARPRRWPAVVLTLLLFPVGLVGLWLSKGYTKFQKIVITFAALIAPQP